MVPFGADMHSHLLPGIDDGVKTIEQSVNTIRKLMDLGYERFVTTPHIMNDLYRNTPEIIRAKELELNTHLRSINLPVTVKAAAEYYLDESTMTAATEGGEFLTFGQNYILFETNFLSEPYVIKEFIFQLTMKGYRPVLAHPERYGYMTMEKAQDLVDRGVLLQINLLSLSGFYQKPVQRLAERLIDEKLVHFLGSDCHNELHAAALANAIKTKAFKKATDLPLLNSTL